VTGKEVVLSGTVTEVSRSEIFVPGSNVQRLSWDQEERVTFSVEGAGSLWAELRIPNRHGWAVGERVAISIVSVEQKQIKEAA
jgi:hypothetical protein